MESVKGLLSLLVDLQALDRVIDSLSDQKNAIPVELAAQRDLLKSHEAKSLDIKKEIEGSQRARRQDELEIEAKNTTMKKLQAQLFEVKTNKEYQAMQTEINGCKEEKAKVEDAMLQKMMAEDEKKRELALAQQQFQAFEKEYKAVEQSLQARLKELEQELVLKRGEREALAAKVEMKPLGVYNKIRKNKDGVALAQVQNGVCGACYMSIRPQLSIELSKGSDLIFCDSCARILYV